MSSDTHYVPSFLFSCCRIVHLSFLRKMAAETGDSFVHPHACVGGRGHFRNSAKGDLENRKIYKMLSGPIISLLLYIENHSCSPVASYVNIVCHQSQVL